MRRPLFTAEELEELRIFDARVDAEFSNWDQMTQRQRYYIARKEQIIQQTRTYAWEHDEEQRAKYRARYHRQKNLQNHKTRSNEKCTSKLKAI